MGNLRSFGSANTPEQKAWEADVHRKGQAMQAENRRKRRALREILVDVLEMDFDGKSFSDEELAEKAQLFAKEQGRSLTLYEAIALAQVKRAIDGDVKAATFVRDSAGDKPIERSEVVGEIITDADRQLLENIQRRLSVVDPE